MDIRDILSNNVLPCKNFIHDCVDTGTPVVLSAGVEVPLSVDCALRNYMSVATKPLWFNATSLIKDTIDDTTIHVKMKLTLNGLKDGIIAVTFVVPHPTFGDLEVDRQERVLYKNNIDTSFTFVGLLYNGVVADAKTHGFKVTLTPSANMTLSDRSILVTV